MVFGHPKIFVTLFCLISLAQSVPILKELNDRSTERFTPKNVDKEMSVIEMTLSRMVGAKIKRLEVLNQKVVNSTDLEETTSITIQTLILKMEQQLELTEKLADQSEDLKEFFNSVLFRNMIKMQVEFTHFIIKFKEIEIIDEKMSIELVEKLTHFSTIGFEILEALKEFNGIEEPAKVKLMQKITQKNILELENNHSSLEHIEKLNFLIVQIENSTLTVESKENSKKYVEELSSDLNMLMKMVSNSTFEDEPVREIIVLNEGMKLFLNEWYNKTITNDNFEHVMEDLEVLCDHYNALLEFMSSKTHLKIEKMNLNKTKIESVSISEEMEQEWTTTVKTLRLLKEKILNAEMITVQTWTTCEARISELIEELNLLMRMASHSDIKQESIRDMFKLHRKFLMFLSEWMNIKWSEEILIRFNEKCQFFGDLYFELLSTIQKENTIRHYETKVFEEVLNKTTTTTTIPSIIEEILTSTSTLRTVTNVLNTTVVIPRVLNTVLNVTTTTTASMPKSEIVVPTLKNASIEDIIRVVNNVTVPSLIVENTKNASTIEDWMNMKMFEEIAEATPKTAESTTVTMVTLKLNQTTTDTTVFNETTTVVMPVFNTTATLELNETSTVTMPVFNTTATLELNETTTVVMPVFNTTSTLELNETSTVVVPIFNTPEVLELNLTTIATPEFNQTTLVMPFFNTTTLLGLNQTNVTMQFSNSTGLNFTETALFVIESLQESTVTLLKKLAEARYISDETCHNSKVSSSQLYEELDLLRKILGSQESKNITEDMIHELRALLTETEIFLNNWLKDWTFTEESCRMFLNALERFNDEYIIVLLKLKELSGHKMTTHSLFSPLNNTLNFTDIKIENIPMNATIISNVTGNITETIFLTNETESKKNMLNTTVIPTTVNMTTITAPIKLINQITIESIELMKELAMLKDSEPSSIDMITKINNLMNDLTWYADLEESRSEDFNPENPEYIKRTSNLIHDLSTFIKVVKISNDTQISERLSGLVIKLSESLKVPLKETSLETNNFEGNFSMDLNNTIFVNNITFVANTTFETTTMMANTTFETTTMMANTTSEELELGTTTMVVSNATTLMASNTTTLMALNTTDEVPNFELESTPPIFDPSKIQFEIRNFSILNHNSSKPNSYSLRIRIKGYKWDNRFSDVKSEESQVLLRTKILPLLYKNLNLVPDEVNEVKLLKLFKGKRSSNSSLEKALNETDLTSEESDDFVYKITMKMGSKNSTMEEEEEAKKLYTLVYPITIIGALDSFEHDLLNNTFEQAFKQAILKHYDGRLDHCEVITLENTDPVVQGGLKDRFPFNMTLQIESVSELSDNDVTLALTEFAVNTHHCEQNSNNVTILCNDNKQKDQDSLLRLSDFWVSLNRGPVQEKLMNFSDLFEFNSAWVFGLVIIACILAIFFIGCIFAICYTRKPYKRSGKVYDMESAIYNKVTNNHKPNMYPTTKQHVIPKHKEVYY